MSKVNVALTAMLLNTDPAIVADACAVRCLRLVETRDVATAATDGVVLLFNPEFFDGLTTEEIIAVLVHEICHVRFGHTERFNESGWIDHERANRSMDREINPIVRNAGYTLPADGCWPSQINQPEGRSWEEYYPHETDQTKTGGGKQPGKQPGESGTPVIGDGCHAAGSLVEKYAADLLDSTDGDLAKLAEEISQQVDDSTLQSKIKEPTKSPKAGNQTGNQNLKVVVEVATNQRWQEVVVGLIATRAAGESIADWSRPGRRSFSTGIYRPSRKKINGFRLALVLDVSGSCVRFFSAWQAMARELVEDVREITELEILYHDTGVTRQEVWSRRTGEEVTISARGGGGTAFTEVLETVETLDVDGAVLFTDSEGSWPQGCSVDCVTVQPPGHWEPSPFGVTVRIPAWN
jgi:predicted metal-dependent peptidase